MINKLRNFKFKVFTFVKNLTIFVKFCLKKVRSDLIYVHLHKCSRKTQRMFFVQDFLSGILQGVIIWFCSFILFKLLKFKTKFDITFKHPIQHDCITSIFLFFKIPQPENTFVPIKQDTYILPRHTLKIS